MILLDYCTKFYYNIFSMQLIKCIIHEPTACKFEMIKFLIDYRMEVGT